MTYSYTQISQYLTCPRRYRHRYLDGWQEKDTRAAMLFGRAFEQAVAALFRREDPAAVLFEHGAAYKDMSLTYSGNDTWDRMLQQGIQLLERFAQDGEFAFASPNRNSKFSSIGRSVPATTSLRYIDAIGELDGSHCVLEWKTTSARYRKNRLALSHSIHNCLLFLDDRNQTKSPKSSSSANASSKCSTFAPQSPTNSDRSSQRLVEDTVRRIESGLFLPQSGIRFPQNPCTSCPFIGLCLDKPDLVEAAPRAQTWS